MRLLFCLFLLTIHTASQAFTFAPTSKLSEPDFLPVEQAFQLSISAVEDGKIIASWQIHDGYYLYQEQFALSGKDADKLHFSPFTPGEKKQDAYYGEVTVYRNQFTLPIYYDINLPAGTQLSAILSYQGCADKGLCYAPQKVPLDFTVPALSSPDLINNTSGSYQASTTGPNKVLPAPHVALSGSQSISQLLQSGDVLSTLLVLFGLGLLLSLTPCVLPMVPIVSAIVVGARSSATRAFYYSAVYVLAMALTYAAIGGLVGLFGTQLNLQAQLQNPILLVISAVIFILLALAMFGVYELKLPSSWQQKLQTSTTHSSSNLRTSGSIFLAGVLSTLIVSPCVSAPLAGTLLYISSQGHAGYGALALFVMALGMGIPLLLVGLFGPKVLPKNGEWLEDIKVLMGFGLLAVAIWLITRWLPFYSHLYLWGVLAISIGSYFTHRAYQAQSHPVRWFLAFSCLFVGAIELLGGAMGNITPFQPLKTTSYQSQVAPQERDIFDGHIGSLEELNNIVNNQDSRPILLDLYADWCISCREVEAMFLSPEVLPLLENVQLIRVDVTENSDQNKALMKKFNLFGPPSLVFLNSQGEERNALTLMGEPTKAEIIERLHFVSQEQ